MYVLYRILGQQQLDLKCIYILYARLLVKNDGNSSTNHSFTVLVCKSKFNPISGSIIFLGREDLKKKLYVPIYQNAEAKSQATIRRTKSPQTTTWFWKSHNKWTIKIKSD
jgi:hypothetical protein